MNKEKLIKILENYSHLDEVIIEDIYNQKSYKDFSFGTRFDDDKSKMIIVINDEPIHHICYHQKCSIIKVKKYGKWFLKYSDEDGSIPIEITHCPYCGEELK
jgi:hypothetical protein